MCLDQGALLLLLLFFWSFYPFKEWVMTMKRTRGGPNAPHIKTLTLGKNILIIQRATGNRPPDTKVVDVHLHGHSYNPLFIFIRSRSCHPLTCLQRQKPPPSLFSGLSQVLGGKKKKSKAIQLPQKNKLAVIWLSSGLFWGAKQFTSRREPWWELEIQVLTRTNVLFIFHPWNAFRRLKSVPRVGRERISNDK